MAFALFRRVPGRGRLVMKRRAKPPFDPKAFLAKANGGRTISTHLKKSVIFAQGDAADAVFNIKTGKVKVTIISKEGKEAVVAILGTDEFFGEGILIGQLKRLATASANGMRDHASGEG
jgi:CRP/FNR family transcriptional regulator, cyclic AMP receptor protein